MYPAFGWSVEFRAIMDISARVSMPITAIAVLSVWDMARCSSLTPLASRDDLLLM